MKQLREKQSKKKLDKQRGNRVFARTCPNSLSRVLTAVILVVAAFIATLSATVATAPEAGAVPNNQFAFPVGGSIPAGDVAWHQQHENGAKAVDIAAGVGSSVHAAQTGVVQAKNIGCADSGSWGCGGGFGNYVIVRHDRVGVTSPLYTLYAHLSAASITVSVNDNVDLNTQLGTVALSGSTTGGHVHFAIGACAQPWSTGSSNCTVWNGHDNGVSGTQGDSLPGTYAELVGGASLDITVFRPNMGDWHTRNGSSLTYGQSGDIPVRADWNGDGSLDAAVFRPSTGQWHIRNVGSFSYGQSGDIPVPGDYDGNGSIEAAVYRPSTGAWHVRGLFSVTYGNAGDVPVPADYNNDGTLDIAVFRPGTNEWHIRNQYSITYGQSGDIPVQADWNSDGYADVAVFRPSTGAWYIRNVGSFTYGQSGDIPMAMDYDGNGYVEAVVFRPSTNLWAVRGILDVIYGQSGDIPATIPLNRTNLQTFGLVA